jgi:glutamate dehydrogenase
MLDPHNSESKKIIRKVISLAKVKLSATQFELFENFAEGWFAHVPFHDLQQKTPQQLVDGTLSQWEFMRQRSPGEYKRRIFNPTQKTDGWESDQTILQFLLDDQPFLVDTISTEINRKGFSINLVIHFGGVKIVRDDKKNIKKILHFDADAPNALSEAPIYIEIDKENDPEKLKDLQEGLDEVVRDARLAVSDWRHIEAQVRVALKEMGEAPPPVSGEELQEAKAFFHWLLDNNFTFLGYRKYDFKTGKKSALRLVPESGLGVLQSNVTHDDKRIRYCAELPDKACEMAIAKSPFCLLAKTNTRSTVHGNRYTDFVSLKRFNKAGEIIGEHWFIGLYTSPVYTENPKVIPIVRLKVAAVLQRSGLPPNGHSYKALRHILDTLPRDDLFQASVDELFQLGMGISQLQDRRCIRLFMRKDVFERFVSCLVYLPRDDFDMALCYRMQDILKEALQGVEISYETSFSDAILARIHFTVRISPDKAHIDDIDEIEKKLIAAGQSWNDGLYDHLEKRLGKAKADELIPYYRRAFPAGYREVMTPAEAVFDVEHIESLTQENTLEMALYRSRGASERMVRFKLFHPKETIPLSDAIPILEKMGLRVIGEQPYHIVIKDGRAVWINDFNMYYSKDHPINIEENRQIFQEAFKRIWFGQAEHDGFSALVLGAHLGWREISMLRAYAKYLRQIGFSLSQEYMERALTNNPVLTRLLVQLFNHRFDPSLQENEGHDLIISGLEADFRLALKPVTNLDEDRILRMFLNLIQSTVRTNYFQVCSSPLTSWECSQHDSVTHLVDACPVSLNPMGIGIESSPKPYISFKFNPVEIVDLPLPHPAHEIFVYSPRFEGLHLRAGKVARGGIRWSDRREDFRTEVLGLMKAQQVKNAVIVPAGAKGGFVAKCLPEEGTREEIMAEGIHCYQNFIRGLLDLTDNRSGETIVFPEKVVRYDEQDPYLVVAADKGTATFSDIANAIAAEYGFWLGDAFASGGSTGYDHKKIGITARGAWESVKQNAQQMDLDIDAKPFTVLGIGDMAGDVFGNGMLLSKQIKLVAAFNGLHIFLDPNPDPKVSFKERSRLFKLSRSSWEDYNPSLISKGGGVYKRSLKAIKLSKQMKDMLKVESEALTPSEIVHLLLKMDVDLLWNGGIGTYVKASTESHLDAGDRANDTVRVNGNELACRMVGEGGNLGFTQLGRIEYELSGGRINTDFIDNSGGVACSDQEVNIKILLNEVVAQGKLTESKRNQLLADMTDDVAHIVLHNNYRQVRAITLSVEQSHKYLGLYARFMKRFVREGKLDLALEFLPDDGVLMARHAAGKGLTRPELAILQAYSKNILKDEITQSDLSSDPFVAHYVQYAFPVVLQKRYAAFMGQHRLHQEIVSTQLSNALITNMGVTFVYQMVDETQASPVDIARAYIVVREIFDSEGYWNAIEALDISAALQIEMNLEVIRLTRRSVRWFLRNQPKSFDVETMITLFSHGVEKVKKLLPQLMPETEKSYIREKSMEWIEAGVPSTMAESIAGLRILFASLNVIEAATSKKVDVEQVATVYFALEDRLSLGEFRELINNYPVESHWMILARSAVKGDLDRQQRILTLEVLKLKDKSKRIEACLDAWIETRKTFIEHWQSLFAEIKFSATLEYAMLLVSMRALSDIAVFET